MLWDYFFQNFIGKFFTRFNCAIYNQIHLRTIKASLVLIISLFNHISNFESHKVLYLIKNQIPISCYDPYQNIL
jgi:hypothetical protein